MKSGLDTIQKKPDAGTVTLEAFRTERHKQCLDVIPDDAGLHRIMEYGFQRFAVLAGHVILVSLSDNFVNGFGGKPALRHRVRLRSPNDSGTGATSFGG